jgi:hypothetical protein
VLAAFLEVPDLDALYLLLNPSTIKPLLSLTSDALVRQEAKGHPIFCDPYWAGGR